MTRKKLPHSRHSRSHVSGVQIASSASRYSTTIKVTAECAARRAGGFSRKIPAGSRSNAAPAVAMDVPAIRQSPWLEEKRIPTAPKKAAAAREAKRIRRRIERVGMEMTSDRNLGNTNIRHRRG